MKKKDKLLTIGQFAAMHGIRTTLCKHHQNMDTLLTMDLSEISIVEKEKRCLVTVDVDRDTTFEREVELITAETEKFRLGRIHEASYGSMISVADLQNASFDNYSSTSSGQKLEFMNCLVLQ